MKTQNEKFVVNLIGPENKLANWTKKPVLGQKMKENGEGWEQKEEDGKKRENNRERKREAEKLLLSSTSPDCSRSGRSPSSRGQCETTGC